MLFFSGESVRKSADEDFPFFTNRNFLYLTGVKQEQSALLLQKKGGPHHVSACLLPSPILSVRSGRAGVSRRKRSTKSAEWKGLKTSTT